jgi:hypothetical protein
MRIAVLAVLAAIAVFLAAAAGAPTAGAAVSVSVTGDQGLRIAVSGSITTEMSVRPNGTKLDVTEQSARMVAGSGCVQVDSANPQRLRCNKPSLNFVTFVGGPLRDRLFVNPGSGDCVCAGNDGNDEIHGSDGADLIEGGNGNDDLTSGAENDVIRGNPGDDVLDGGAGGDTEEGGAGDDFFPMGGIRDGADVVSGGDGFDEVSYAGRRNAVTIKNDGNPSSGERPGPVSGLLGEGDRVSTTVNVMRGTGNDDLIQAQPTSTLIGGGGDDSLIGTPGNDVLRGDEGSDRYDAGGGADTLQARDAVDDQAGVGISCGTGTGDTLDADVRDDDTRALPVDCEAVSQGMVGEHPNVRIRSAKRAGRRLLKVRLSCPRKTRNGCKGRLSVGSARKRARFGPSKRYRIRRGRSKVVRVRVRRRSQARRGKRVRVRSVEKGRLGRRTTLRTLKVRR